MQVALTPGKALAILPPMAKKPNSSSGRLSPLEVIWSALAAAFGVQSSKNRQRDFAHGKPMHFIAAGIILTALFVLGIASLVLWIVAPAAG
jgi:hypothetical protein